MFKRKYYLYAGDHAIRNNCLACINSEIDRTKHHVVTIVEKKSIRSNAQNNLMWDWNTIIGNELGYTKEEFHIEMKIAYNREMEKKNETIEDDKKHFGVYQKVEKCKKKDSFFFERQIKEYGKITSTKEDDGFVFFRVVIPKRGTRDMNIDEMTDYLKYIEAFASNHNIIIHDDDEEKTEYNIAINGV